MPVQATSGAASAGAAKAKGAPATYRYLRYRQTANVAGNNLMILWELDFSDDNQATWKPTSAMTANSAPSPLVALADSEFSGSFQAFHGFDNNNATRFTSANTAHPHWLQIDFGSGNGIAPTHVRMRVYNDGTDYSPKDGAVYGSNTGAFAGEEVLLKSFSGLTGNADGTNVIIAIP